MTTTVLSEMRLHRAVVDGNYTQLRAILDETRRFDGCERLELLIDDQDDTRVVLLVQWASEQDLDAYHTWRAENGAADLLALLSEPSKVRRYTPR